jgi:hypothetical protein
LELLEKPQKDKKEPPKVSELQMELDEVAEKELKSKSSKNTFIF